MENGKINFDKKMTEIISSLNNRGRLFLHCCCAVCASSVLERLTKDLSVTCFFYNPNIESGEEFNLRKSEMEKLISAKFKGVELVCPPYNKNEFLTASRGYESEKEGGLRCRECFSLRLNATFNKMQELGGFDYFATTLTVSPLKNAKLINEIGEGIGKEKYLASDFKKMNGYKRSGEIALELNLYRQNYCGCSFSKMKNAEEKR